MISNIKLKKLNNGIALIIIDEPQTYNALSFKNLNDLIKALKKLDQDKSTKVIIIEGSGKGFSAGHNLKEVKNLKTFFNDAIQKNKLKRTKDVQYNKETGKITSVPSLFFNKISRNFTLRNNEKRVSTLKSLTPKRVSNKNKATIPEKDKID